VCTLPLAQTASQSVQPFLFFCTAHEVGESLYFTIDRPFPLKLPIRIGRPGPHLIHALLDPSECTSQTASRSVQPFSHDSRLCIGVKRVKYKRRLLVDLVLNTRVSSYLSDADVRTISSSLCISCIKHSQSITPVISHKFQYDVSLTNDDATQRHRRRKITTVKLAFACFSALIVHCSRK